MISFSSQILLLKAVAGVALLFDIGWLESYHIGALLFGNTYGGHLERKRDLLLAAFKDRYIAC